MRCPKCQYIGFDTVDRCRNCGYEFSLAVEADTMDLPIRTGTEPEPSPALPAGATGAGPLQATPNPARRSRAGGDLPLFKDRRGDEDAPLVAPPIAPRAPLSVRRSAPVPPRGRGRTAVEPGLELPLAQPETRAASADRHRRSVPAASPRVVGTPADEDGVVAAGAGPRLAAAFIDLSLVAAIDAAVLYFTLQLTGFALAELRALPPVPLFGFLLLLTGAYFVSFKAAGGQTIGKMATGIRVIPAEPAAGTGDRVPLGHAALRAAASAVSILPAGLGYLPALFGGQRRAIHDRLADTRVVKA